VKFLLKGVIQLNSPSLLNLLWEACGQNHETVSELYKIVLCDLILAFVWFILDFIWTGARTWLAAEVMPGSYWTTILTGLLDGLSTLGYMECTLYWTVWRWIYCRVILSHKLPLTLTFERYFLCWLKHFVWFILPLDKWTSIYRVNSIELVFSFFSYSLFTSLGPLSVPPCYTYVSHWHIYRESHLLSAKESAISISNLVLVTPLRA